MEVFVIFTEFATSIISPTLVPVLWKKGFKLNDGVDPALVDLGKTQFSNYFGNTGVAGIGRYAVMLIGDTLKTACKLTDAEMLGVVGHELGHRF